MLIINTKVCKNKIVKNKKNIFFLMNFINIYYL